MKFIDDRDGARIEFTIPEESNVDEVLEEFQNFLRACGYVIDYNKKIELVNLDE